MKTNMLAVKQLDKQLRAWEKARGWFQVKGSWIRVIRKTLGITTKQLAKRLGISRSRIIKIESDEAKGVLTMKTLSMVAESLNCDLMYAFVPRKPLQKMLEEQADKIAVSRIREISHNMLLEKQSLSEKQNKEQVAELKARLLDKSFNKLWGEQ